MGVPDKPARVRRRLTTVTVEKPRCPACGSVRLRKYRTIRDQGDGSSLWWVQCANAACSKRYTMQESSACFALPDQLQSQLPLKAMCYRGSNGPARILITQSYEIHDADARDASMVIILDCNESKDRETQGKGQIAVLRVLFCNLIWGDNKWMSFCHFVIVDQDDKPVSYRRSGQ